MGGVNVDVESLQNIYEMLNELQQTLNHGFSESLAKIKEIERKVDEAIRSANIILYNLNNSIECCKRNAARVQEEYERALKEYDEGKRRECVLPYNGLTLEKISVMEKQKRQLEEALGPLIRMRKVFGNEAEVFLHKFNEVAAAGASGGDNKKMQIALTKLIGSLNNYLGIYFTMKAASTPSEYGSAENSVAEQGSPIGLERTRQEWHVDSNGNRVFDSPVETGAALNCCQGALPEYGGEGVEGFRGTCGLVSCENVMRMAGINITEADVVNYARTHMGEGERNLCTTDSIPEHNGGTSWRDRQIILRHYGIETEHRNVNAEQLAESVESGRGVILSVDASVLRYGRGSIPPNRHAITVTSVERDADTNQIRGFYICDSGSHNNDYARLITTDVLTEAMRVTNGEANITRNIIR